MNKLNILTVKIQSNIMSSSKIRIYIFKDKTLIKIRILYKFKILFFK